MKLLSKKDEILANFVAQVTFILTLIITTIITLSTLGVQTTSIITVLGTVGIAVALALKDYLSSIAGGIILIILHPFKKGDIIEISGLEGKVEALDFLIPLYACMTGVWRFYPIEVLLILILSIAITLHVGALNGFVG